ncbi:MAG: DUF3644 domain-containing protein [Gammaproteobacteria bacterium]|nr:DUF3644 domain-containing protein [Gammaproteobacteria bacterium]
MNSYGSYKSLVGNSISAMLAGIEIYNKPRIEYRNECFVILLLNSWELLLKGICSKNKVRIFKPKKRGEPYKTLNLLDSLESARPYFPQGIHFKAVEENIGRLMDYRNNAVHFYNDSSLEVVIYGLAQTSIVNYRDIVLNVFGKDISSETNIALLPLSFTVPPDPIKFLGRQSKHPAPISEFLKIISDTTSELEREGIDTGRFLTVFKVNLQSTKKIASADIVAGVENAPDSGVLLVSKKIDPNKTHPFTQKRVIKKVGAKVDGAIINTRSVQALLWKYDLRVDEHYCWKNDNTNTYQYSHDLVTWLKKLKSQNIEQARDEYSLHIKKKRAKGGS